MTVLFCTDTFWDARGDEIEAIDPTIEVVRLVGTEQVMQRDIDRITIAFFSPDAWPDRAAAFMGVCTRAPNLDWMQSMSAGTDHPVFSMLRDQGAAISDDACREGLASARLPARVERFDGTPPVIVDTAHNDASAKALVEAVEGLDITGPKTLVLAVSRDKDLDTITAILAPAFDRIIATRFVENPRAVDPDQLAELCRRAGPVETMPTETKPSATVTPVDDPQEAWRQSREQTPADGLIAIAGSFFIAAELRPLVIRTS